MLACVMAGCTAPSVTPSSAPRSPTTACDYDVRLTSLEDPIVEVRARCDGGEVRGFIALEGEMAHHVSMEGADAPIRRQGASFLLDDGAAADVTYRFNLDEVAYDHADIDVVYKAGRAWVVAGSTYLLRPHPAGDQVRVRVTVSVPEGSRFASGMHHDGDRHQLTVGELRHATYGIFGELVSETFELPGPLALDEALVERSAPRSARLEVVTLPGRLRTRPEVRARWIRDAAGAMVDFWRGFPVERACVVIIPTPGHRGVAHGKVVATGGATVAIHLGAEAQREDLYRDWILVHELFHLGFPSFLGEGKWLDEGLATYYEPIIRSRAGWRSPLATWGEFVNDMPQGIAALESSGVANAQSFKGIYWGGAILSLLADVEIRKRSNGARGLEDALRGVLARGGNASQIWTLDDAIAAIDVHAGQPTLRPIADRYAFQGNPFDLSALLSSLGVSRDDEAEHGVRLSADAPLSAIRDHIVAPIDRRD